MENVELDDDGKIIWTPGLEAELKQSIQDCNDGFTYEMLPDEGEGWRFKCNKCDRVADIHERPFPHKLNCPMRKI